MPETIIIGAGIAGLAAAYQAKLQSRSAEIYESRDRAGGLLDNILIDGFCFDTAVHLSFASEFAVREVFDRTPHITHIPVSLNWDNGYWLKHPAQTNMHPLPAEEKVNLIKGLINAESGNICNYQDWLVQQYGYEIAERWPLKYTRKYWTIEAARLGTAWVGQRMRKADISEVLMGAFDSKTPNQYYVKEMRYPERGGYKAFIQHLIDEANIHYNLKAICVNFAEKKVTFSGGLEVAYERLISTMPLPELISIAKDVPDDIKQKADSLYATEIDLISVGFRIPNVSPALWFYIYDEDILASRAYSPNRKSPANVPEGCSALQFEIYWSREKPRNLSIEEIKQNTLQAIIKMGLAHSEDIMFMHHTYVPYANVVFDLGMEERRDVVRSWVERQGVSLAGRFGEWEYLWSNQSMMSGLNAYIRAWSA
ncbi:protoporphyrinogen/coproporphyrinogen oxidase [Nitrospirillum sp. BR 11163]|uniref:protoporphyrinogen/coproporphyrinogen oxidase n=1 Tax=Nitrospirillum sp. BR 11163 TaxID=3104323 RepID=UPI002AFF9EF0|nr:FAD-dependent oxidoreductase [Nitrospirillum sp. BR 11163]MEA1673532.1 FAD-dependent oxidoreductase [Nitrospirillum sp. BR 11163]